MPMASTYPLLAKQVAFRRERFGGVLHDGRKWLEVNGVGYRLLLLADGMTNLVDIADIGKVPLEQVLRFFSELQAAGLAQLPCVPSQKKICKEIGKPENLQRASWMLRGPLKVGIEITGICSHKCSFCSAVDYPNHHMPMSTVCDIVEQCREMGVFSMAISGGEPFLHPEILEIVNLFKVRGRPLLSPITTNGSAQVREKVLAAIEGGMQLLQISLPFACAGDFNKYTGGDFREVDRTISEVLRTDCDLVLCSALLEPEISDVESIVDYALSKGIHWVHFMTMMSIGRAGRKHRRLTVEEYFAYLEKVIEIQERHKGQICLDINTELLKDEHTEAQGAANMFSGCKAGRTEFYVLPNGDVFPCQFLVGWEKYRAGSVTDNLHEIWCDSVVLEELRERRRAETEVVNCDGCEYRLGCKGGCPAEERLSAADGIFRCSAALGASVLSRRALSRIRGNRTFDGWFQ